MIRLITILFLVFSQTFLLAQRNAAKVYHHTIFLDERGYSTDETNAYAVEEFDEVYCKRVGEYEKKRISDDLLLRSGQFLQGERVGIWKEFFETGQLKQEKNYDAEDRYQKNYYKDGQLASHFTMNLDSLEVLVSAYKPDGTQIVENGNGFYQSFSEDKQLVTLEGNYEFGLRHGTFTYYNLEGEITHTNEYERGELIERTDEYSPEVFPQPKGGTDALRKKFKKNFKLKYKDTKNITEFDCARVIVRFVVDVDGSIGEVYALTNYGHNLEQKAIDAIRSYKKPFEPGMQNGKPVPVWFTMPFEVIITN